MPTYADIHYDYPKGGNSSFSQVIYGNLTYLNT